MNYHQPPPRVLFAVLFVAALWLGTMQLPPLAPRAAAARQTPASPGYAARGIGGEAIAVDASGNAYLLTSQIRDGTSASRDLYLSKLNPTATEIMFTRFLGGRDEDFASALALDAQGNIYLTGYTASPDLPNAINSLSSPDDDTYDAFVMKLNPAGTQVLYSRYLGGKVAEKATDLAVDGNGNVYVTGTTNSTDFPVSGDAVQPQRKDPTTTDATAAFDAFVAKLNPSGAMVYSTYLGGSQEERSPRLAINAAGDIFVAGFTTSADFPNVHSLHPPSNVFLAKLSPARAVSAGLLFSTFFSSSQPGEYPSLRGEVAGLKTDATGNVYLLGTGLTDMTTPGAFQTGFGSGFVAKLNGEGTALLYLTMLGSHSVWHGPPLQYGPEEYPHGLAVDAVGNVYVTGNSIHNLPVTPDAMQARVTPSMICGTIRRFDWQCADAFVLKLNASGTALLYSSLLGGNSGETGRAIALDSAGNSYVTGTMGEYGYIFSGTPPTITFPSTVPAFNTGRFFTAKFNTATNQTANPSVHVSAASFLRQGLPPESIATAFGNGLATATAAAARLPLPTTLEGTTVKVGDQLAPLFYVSPTQINYLVPAGTAGFSVPVVITNGAGAVSISSIRIGGAPGLFTANADGRGLAAAVALRIKADGSQSYEPLTRFDATTQRFVAVPLDLGAETDRIYLVLFGTGWHGISGTTSVSANLGGVNAEVVFAGPQAALVGVDQVNVLVPRSLAGSGEVEVSLTFLQQTSNTVRVVIK